MEEQQSSSPVFERGQCKPVPDFLSEEYPFYDWAWPAETPRYFSVDIFSENSAFRVFSDEATDWYSRDLTAKLKSMVPKPRNENRKTEEEVRHAAQMIQKQWRIRGDRSYTNVSESKLTREFGQPEDSLHGELLGRPSAITIKGNKSLSTLLRTVQREETVNGGQQEMREFVCDISEIKDEANIKQVSVDTSRFSQSRENDSNLNKQQKQPVKAEKDAERSIIKKKQQDDKSFYSFANKPKCGQLEASTISEQGNSKPKKKNAIVYVPSSSRTSSSSINMHKCSSEVIVEVVKDADTNPTANSMDDIIFQTLKIGVVDDQMNESIDSKPLEDLLSDSIVSARDNAFIEPATLIKKLDFGIIIAATDNLDRSDISYTPVDDDEDRQIEASVRVEHMTMVKDSCVACVERDAGSSDISVDLPPPHSSLRNAGLRMSGKQMSSVLGRKGRAKEIEVVMVEEQEVPKCISVERTRLPAKSEVDFQCYDSARAQGNQIKSQKGSLTKTKPHCCKNSDIPFLKESASKRTRKECSACRHSAQKDHNKENKSSERKSSPLTTISERRTSPIINKNSVGR